MAAMAARSTSWPCTTTAAPQLTCRGAWALVLPMFADKTAPALARQQGMPRTAAACFTYRGARDSMQVGFCKGYSPGRQACVPGGAQLSLHGRAGARVGYPIWALSARRFKQRWCTRSRSGSWPVCVQAHPHLGPARAQVHGADGAGVQAADLAHGVCVRARRQLHGPGKSAQGAHHHAGQSAHGGQVCFTARHVLVCGGQRRAKPARVVLLGSISCTWRLVLTWFWTLGPTRESCQV